MTKSEVVDKRVAAAPLKSNDRSFSQNLALVRGVEARLRGAADPVCREVSGDVCAFTVRIVDNDNPNASANERSEVVLNTGLLRYLDGEDEVAAVMAHEISHHAANHLGERRRNTTLGAAAGGLLLGAAVAAIGADRNTVNEAMRAGSRVGARIGALSYSVEEENEADYIGAYIMSRAGYDISGAASLFDKFGQLSPRSTNDANFGSTHPSTPERGARNDKIREEIALKRVLGQSLLPTRRPARVAEDDCDGESRADCS